MKEGCVEWATCGVEACTISISPRCRLPSTSSASLQRALAGIQCCRRILGRESLRASSSSVAAVAQSFFGKAEDAEDHWRSGRFADSTSADVHLRQIRVKYCKWFKLIREDLNGWSNAGIAQEACGTCVAWLNDGDFERNKIQTRKQGCTIFIVFYSTYSVISISCFSVSVWENTLATESKIRFWIWWGQTTFTLWSSIYALSTMPSS